MLASDAAAVGCPPRIDATVSAPIQPSTLSVQSPWVPSTSYFAWEQLKARGRVAAAFTLALAGADALAAALGLPPLATVPLAGPPGSKALLQLPPDELGAHQAALSWGEQAPLHGAHDATDGEVCALACHAHCTSVPRWGALVACFAHLTLLAHPTCFVLHPFLSPPPADPWLASCAADPLTARCLATPPNSHAQAASADAAQAGVEAPAVRAAALLDLLFAGRGLPQAVGRLGRHVAVYATRGDSDADVGDYTLASKRARFASFDTLPAGRYPLLAAGLAGQDAVAVAGGSDGGAELDAAFERAVSGQAILAVALLGRYDFEEPQGAAPSEPGVAASAEAAPLAGRSCPAQRRSDHDGSSSSSSSSSSDDSAAGVCSDGGDGAASSSQEEEQQQQQQQQPPAPGPLDMDAVSLRVLQAIATSSLV
jgi:hypothetical protein